MHGSVALTDMPFFISCLFFHGYKWRKNSMHSEQKGFVCTTRSYVCVTPTTSTTIHLHYAVKSICDWRWSKGSGNLHMIWDTWPSTVSCYLHHFSSRVQIVISIAAVSQSVSQCPLLLKINCPWNLSHSHNLTSAIVVSIEKHEQNIAQFQEHSSYPSSQIESV